MALLHCMSRNLPTVSQTFSIVKPLCYYKRLALNLGVLSAFFASITLNAANDRQKIVRVHSNASPAFERYYQAITYSALEVTASAYGPYELTVEERRPSAERIGRGLLSGEWHVLFVSNIARFEKFHAHPDIDIKVRAIFRGLMGLRQFVVRKQNLEKFASISTLSDLRNIKIGQGHDWSEKKIYENAKISVVGSKDYSTLVPMLTGNRFDAIPLSVLEITSSMEEFRHQYSDLAIVPNLFVYYPLPKVSIVAKRDVRIHKRLETGLNFMLEKENLDALLEEHFKVSRLKLNDKSNRIIYMNNPDISDEKNIAYMRKFRSDNLIH